MALKTTEYMPSVHCNINEQTFSKVLFISRFLAAAALLYLAIGSLLYWREFMVNTAALGVGRWTVGMSLALPLLEMAASALLLLGWHTRWTALATVPLAWLGCWIFFAKDHNPIFVVICLLFAAVCCVPMGLGGGIFSLDFKRSQRAACRRGKL